MPYTSYQWPEYSQLVIDEFKDLPFYIQDYKNWKFNTVKEIFRETLEERQKINISLEQILDDSWNIKKDEIINANLWLYDHSSIWYYLEKLNLSEIASFEIERAMKKNINRIFDEKYIQK